jgi:hypothetical protein
VDGPAKNARFGSIRRLMFDGAGGLFVFESWRIRKLTADNRVMTLAGIREGDPSPEKTLSNNSPGFEYQFDSFIRFPKVDSNGNIYLVDGGEETIGAATILKITPQ